MSLDNEAKEALQEWLVKALEPICDADPDVLAKYVLALVQNDKDREGLQSLCVSKLSEFLGDETSGFVSSLFRALNDGSYKPSAQVKHEEPCALANDREARSSRRRDRSPSGEQASETSDQKSDLRGPTKRRKPEEDRDRRRSSPQRGQERTYRGDRDSYGNGRRGGDVYGRGRGRDNMRDLRGDRRRGPNDWNGVRGNWGPQGGRGPMRGGRGEFEEYSPENPSGMGGGRLGGSVMGGRGVWPSLGAPMMGAPMGYAGPMGIGPDMGGGPLGGRGVRGRGRGEGGRGRGRGRGKDREELEQEQRLTTLKVSNFDPKYINMTKLSIHFSKFGEVVNVQMRPKFKAAFVQYTSHEEAKKAFQSPIPVCNNRFIEVKWARYDPKDLVAADNETMKKESEEEQKKEESISKSTEEVAAKGKEVLEQKRLLLGKQKDLNKQKETLLTQQIEQHKLLLSRMDENPSGRLEDKANFQAKVDGLETELRKLQGKKSEGLNGLKEELSALESEASQLGLGGRGRGRGRSRGRGRGRGRFGYVPRGRGRDRGRGGMRSLDNRPTTIKIENLPAEGLNAEAIKGHFGAFGAVETVSVDSGAAFVKFQERYVAESAMNQGSSFGATKLAMHWHVGSVPGVEASSVTKGAEQTAQA